MKTFEQHPLSAIFPKMSPEAFKELIDDIDMNGVRDKIIVYDNKILDGWHRYQACLELKVAKPPMVEFEGDDPAGFVLSKNLHRRHLSAGVRALILAQATEWQQGSGRISKSLERAKESGNFTTLTQAAELAQVSPKTMQQARKATLAIDEVQQAVSEGKLSINKAAKLADKPPEEQKTALKKALSKDPAPKKAPDSVPMDVYQELKKAYEELEDDYDTASTELEMAQKELAAVESFRNNEQVKELMKLNHQLRSMTEARDQWQNKCNELTKQLNYLENKNKSALKK